MRLKTGMTILLLAASFTGLASSTARAATPSYNTSDTALVKELPGFENHFATVNGVRIHYVAGGKGSPLVLLPGWPETWWAYHKVMPALAEQHFVIVVDLRGMGSSGKPESGYDKKTMAEDISELVKHLGYQKVDIVGHDIGAMVAFSFAENHPDQTNALMMLDVAHPSAGYMSIPMLPQKGTFGDKIDPDHPYLWWFAFNQVPGLPEQLLAGREYLIQDWFYHYMSINDNAIDAKDRAVYAAAYASSDAIRASDGWYQAFPQDVIDDGTYGKLSMPVIGLGGPGYKRLKASLDAAAPGSQTIQIPDCGHFIAEEKPAVLISYVDKMPN
jgi:pimeloyl-ACP methyl ester carboxylesterase